MPITIRSPVCLAPTMKRNILMPHMAKVQNTVAEYMRVITGQIPNTLSLPESKLIINIAVLAT